VLLGFVPFADHLEDKLSGPRQDEEEAGHQAERVGFGELRLSFWHDFSPFDLALVAQRDITPVPSPRSIAGLK